MITSSPRNSVQHNQQAKVRLILNREKKRNWLD